jgi:lactoylglutathione lyase
LALAAIYLTIFKTQTRKMKLLSALMLIVFSCSAPNAVLAQASAARSGARLNHIALYVTDLQRATQFYLNVVGLDTIPEPFHDGRHTWFLVGPKSHLHIISGAQTPLPKEKNTHLCFTVSSVADFIPRLTKNNVAYENWLGEKLAVTNRVDGVKQIYFQDPDGYWIEVNDARE